MSWKLRVRLSLMMFLQYAVWGAWAPVLFPYLAGKPEEGGLGFSGYQAGWVFGAFWLACIVAPFIAGQIVDRWFPTQWFLAVVHLVGGFLLFAAAGTRGFAPLIVVMIFYSLLYAPTLALTNSLSFHHLKDTEKEFGAIRAFGTIGWIVIGLLLSLWRWLEKGAPVPADCLILAAACSIAMGIFSCFLPHTPPKKEAKNPWAFLEALRLFKDKNFAVFMIICFVVTTELQFYYIPTPEFLEKGVGLAPKNIPAIMTIAQIAEMITLALLLPLLLPKLGIRKILAIGVIAWPLRYVAFAIGKPPGLVIGSMTLHGIGFTFFFVVAQIYVNKISPSDIQASAQSLFTLITLGIGSFLGSQFTGWILDLLKVDTPAVRNWTWIFLIPCFLTVACAVAFLLWFKEPEKKRSLADSWTSPGDQNP